MRREHTLKEESIQTDFFIPAAGELREKTSFGRKFQGRLDLCFSTQWRQHWLHSQEIHSQTNTEVTSSSSSSLSFSVSSSRSISDSVALLFLLRHTVNNRERDFTDLKYYRDIMSLTNTTLVNGHQIQHPISCGRNIEWNRRIKVKPQLRLQQCFGNVISIANMDTTVTFMILILTDQNWCVLLNTNMDLQCVYCMKSFLQLIYTP